MTTELLRALAILAEPPAAHTSAIAAALDLPGRPDPAEYTDLFVLQLWPYASIYVGGEGKVGGEARDRVAGFWRALRLTPPAEPDHLAALLGLYATVAETEANENDAARRQLRRRSRQALLWEHLLCWLPPYLTKMDEIGTPFYRAWGELLRETLNAEAEELGAPERLPLHLREAPALTEPDEILAPVRSGMVFVRNDLKRAANSLGLGLRQGERSYVLKSLLAQDPTAMLGWLGEEAARWVHLHRAMPDQLQPVRDFWVSRAEISAEMLGAQIPA
ncbi:MAG TPA: molecular chaperone TorD family protein [Candidatus Dormibacteraeota bacterium]|nr:molecular chaperone TorD family protein [Candidatus Dormibacteraeota bacterium]